MRTLAVQSIEKKVGSMQQELKIYYPKTLFIISKKTENNQIFLCICYCDGPLSSKVKSILHPFISGFYTDAGEKRICHQVERSMSKEVEATLLAETKRVLRIDKDLSPEDILPSLNQTAGAYIREIFRFREFY